VIRADSTAGVLLLSKYLTTRDVARIRLVAFS